MADAGWYTDPQDPLSLRWFDGREWTDRVTPNPAIAPAPAEGTGLLSHPGLTGPANAWYYVLNVIGGAGLYFAKVSAKKALREIGTVDRLSGWEVFWYYLHCLFFGQGYFVKVSYKRALADAGHGDPTTGERAWYRVLCVLFGIGYFMKLEAAKALDDAGAGALTRAQQRWYAFLCGFAGGGYLGKLPMGRALEQARPLAFRPRGPQISRASRVVLVILGVVLFAGWVGLRITTAPSMQFNEAGGAPTLSSVEGTAVEFWDFTNPVSPATGATCDYAPSRWAVGYRFSCTVEEGASGPSASVVGTVESSLLGDALSFTRS